MRNTWTLVAGLLASDLCAQVDSVALRFAATISEADLRTHLTELASDAYEGRETGYAGQKKAAAYLKERFNAYGIGALSGLSGITDGYFQRFELIEEQPGAISLVVADKQYEFLKDVLYFSDQLGGARSYTSITYCGAGELAGVAPETKVALVMLPAPKGSEASDPGLDALDGLAEIATMKEMELLLVCSDRFVQATEAYGHWLNGSRVRLADDSKPEQKRQRAQVVVVSPTTAAALLVANGKSFAKEWRRAQLGRRTPPRIIQVPVAVAHKPRRKTITSENVLAYVEGSDKKDELIVVTAHYDHIGAHNGEVYNGADDDGSGTVALLEMAEAFAQAKAAGHGPRRSVLFMPVSGEEKGLLGSRYYSEHPVFPLEATVADLNIDMIGRFDSAHASSAPYVYIIGSDRLSTDLHRINQRANETYVELVLDESFNAHDDPNRFYYRSDHYNFARKGIPVIFYFSGVHEDYHQPGDEVEKIRFDLLHQRTLLVFHTAWILAGREDRIVVDGKIEGN